MSDTITQAQIVNMLKRRQGRRSDTVFAAELGISSSYLSLIKLGLREPGPKVIHALGLKKVYVKNGNSNGHSNGNGGGK